MVAGAVAVSGLLFFVSKIDRHFELRQHVLLDVQGQFGARAAPLGCSHDGAQVIRAEVHLVGQREFRGGNSELAGLRRMFEHLITAGIFYLKNKLAAGGGFMTRAVERQRAHMDCLPRLIDRLLRGEQDRGRIIKADLLGDFTGADGRVHHVTQRICSRQARRKAELGFGRAVMIQGSRE